MGTRIDLCIGAVAMLLVVTVGCRSRPRVDSVQKATPYTGAGSVESQSLRRIADAELRVGFTIDEVDRQLSARGLSRLAMDHSPDRTTIVFRVGESRTPLLHIVFQPDDKRNWKVTDWRIEDLGAAEQP